MELKYDPRDELICLRAHKGVEADHGAVLPPIAQASLFRRPDMASLLDGLGKEDKVPVYSRGTNPTVAVLEETLAQLERGEVCKCFASGMGAIAAVLTGLLEAGDHVLFVNTIYGPTIELAERLGSFGITFDRTDARTPDEIEPCLRPETRMIYMESPGSTIFRLLPVGAICTLARSRDIITVLDNSVATPLLQKPIELGADLVVHSCSKYIGGHSDAIGGAVIGPQELVRRVFYNSYMLLGAVMEPFTAWLMLRGLMTLPTRLARHAADAAAIAQFLRGHSRVAAVNHPALVGSDADLFADQMRGYSGLFSFVLDGSFEEALHVADRLELFGKAVSWGGPESLVMSGHKTDPGADHAGQIPRSLLRLSIGFEGVDALIADLEGALS